MKNEKIYGSTKTNLILTEKAQRFYNDADPLTIIETDVIIGEGSDERGDYFEFEQRYTLKGIIEDDNLTAQEVNELLESLQDECETIE